MIYVLQGHNINDPHT